MYLAPKLLLFNAKGQNIFFAAMESIPGGYCREVISIAAIAVEHERAMASQAWRPTSTLQNSPTMPPTRFPPAMHSPEACVAVPICVPWPHSTQATNIAACLCSYCAQIFELVLLLLNIFSTYRPTLNPKHSYCVQAKSPSLIWTWFSI